MTGLGRYRALLALPGVRWPVVASAAGSLPIGMYILGIVLLGREATGSFADAGRVAGAFGLANALGAVAQGRLMDRLGQPRVLRTAAAVHAVAVAGLVVAASERASTWTLALCAAAGGVSLPQVPAAMRSLWGSLVAEPEQRESAYALVAIVFEVSVVAAPALVALIAAAASPEAAVLTAACLAVAGGVGFAATAGSRGWRGEPHEVGWLGPLAAPGMRTVFAVLAAFGAAMGVLQVALPAFGAERGSAEEGGLLLAALSAGSLVGGVLYGSRTWPGSLVRRLVTLLLGLGAGCALLAVADSYALLAALLVAGGDAGRAGGGGRLDPARRRRARGDRNRGVRRDDHGHRRRQRGGQRARGRRGRRRVLRGRGPHRGRAAPHSVPASRSRGGGR